MSGDFEDIDHFHECAKCEQRFPVEKDCEICKGEDSKCVDCRFFDGEMAKVETWVKKHLGY